jgi:hypothetical protein
MLPCSPSHPRRHAALVTRRYARFLEPGQQALQQRHARLTAAPSSVACAAAGRGWRVAFRRRQHRVLGGGVAGAAQRALHVRGRQWLPGRVHAHKVEGVCAVTRCHVMHRPEGQRRRAPPGAAAVVVIVKAVARIAVDDDGVTGAAGTRRFVIGGRGVLSAAVRLPVFQPRVQAVAPSALVRGWARRSPTPSAGIGRILCATALIPLLLCTAWLPLSADRHAVIAARSRRRLLHQVCEPPGVEEGGQSRHLGVPVAQHILHLTQAAVQRRHLAPLLHHLQTSRGTGDERGLWGARGVRSDAVLGHHDPMPDTPAPLWHSTARHHGGTRAGHRRGRMEASQPSLAPPPTTT